MRGSGLLFMGAALMGSMALIYGARAVERVPWIERGLGYLGRNSLCLLAVHPICGEARAAWVKAGMPTGVSWILELAAMAGCMYLLTGPLKRFVKWPFGKKI